MAYKSAKINELMKQYEELELQKNKIKCLLAEAGLEADEVIYLHSDIYGASERLILEDDDYHGFERGDWLPSSMSC